MILNFKQIFLELDAGGFWEHPNNFDGVALRKKVVIFMDDFRTLLTANEEVHFDEEIQDASFYCDLRVKVKSEQGVDFVNIPAIRFSNFGFLASISKREWILDREKAIADMLLRHGFVNVPRAHLDTPYDGVIPEKEKVKTWWGRFFDFY